MNYENPTPVVVLIIPIITTAGHLAYLTHVRGIEPQLGGVAFCSGYVDKLESAEMAAMRECSEEVGLHTAMSDWEPIVTKVTESNRLLIFMRLRDTLPEGLIRHSFTPNREVQELTVSVPGDGLCFSTHTEVLKLLSTAPKLA